MMAPVASNNWIRIVQEIANGLGVHYSVVKLIVNRLDIYFADPAGNWDLRKLISGWRFDLNAP